MLVRWEKRHKPSSFRVSGLISDCPFSYCDCESHCKRCIRCMWDALSPSATFTDCLHKARIQIPLVPVRWINFYCPKFIIVYSTIPSGRKPIFMRYFPLACWCIFANQLNATSVMGYAVKRILGLWLVSIILQNTTIHSEQGERAPLSGLQKIKLILIKSASRRVTVETAPETNTGTVYTPM